MLIQTVSDAARMSHGLNTLSLVARNDLVKELQRLSDLLEYNVPIEQRGVRHNKVLFYATAHEIFLDICNKYGEAAEALALQVLESEGIDPRYLSAQNHLAYTYAKGTANVDAIINKAMTQPNDGVSYLIGAIDEAIKRRYRKPLIDSGERWARIPSGSYTCPWCVMLASRGFVYLSKENAGYMDRWHAYCDCVVTVKKKGGIDGYDPSYLYSLYKQKKGIGEKPKDKPALDTDGFEIAA